MDQFHLLEYYLTLYLSKLLFFLTDTTSNRAIDYELKQAQSINSFTLQRLFI